VPVLALTVGPPAPPVVPPFWVEYPTWPDAPPLELLDDEELELLDDEELEELLELELLLDELELLDEEPPPQTAAVTLGPLTSR
jgi:hypothetical protein